MKSMEQPLLSKEDIVNEISEIYDEECEKRVLILNYIQSD